ncbi:hypothetical protein C8J56DRAFT_1062093 [Mycena floridula]|nr:hypothetical protein C8J56DRAFT_1062093 [Mycena floridula]
MPAPRGSLWQYFHKGDKANTSHYRAHCYGCIESHRPATAPIFVSSDSDDPYAGLDREGWFKAALAKTGTGVLGEKKAMTAHLKKCTNASSFSSVAPAKSQFSVNHDEHLIGRFY